MTFPIRRYPLNPTGTSINNFVANEEHVLGVKTGPYHPIAPFYGPFFNNPETLEVYKAGVRLVPSVDYWGVNMIQDDTAQFSGEVCEVLVVKGMLEGDVITLSYFNLGGLFQNYAKGLEDLYATYIVDNRPIDWAVGIKNKPEVYPPSYHLHMLNDVVGWEAVVAAIERLNNSITLQNVPAFESLIDWVNARFENIAINYSIDSDSYRVTFPELHSMIDLPNTTNPLSVNDSKFITLRNLFEFKLWFKEFIDAKASLMSPQLLGLPKAPTALPEADNTEIATTAFVKRAIREHMTMQLMSYSITPDVLELNEGSVVSFLVSTVNVADNVVLYYILTGSAGLNANDFTDGTLTGQVTVVNNGAVFTKTLLNDLSVEGIETFRARLHASSSAGPFLATSVNVSIVDSSKPLVSTYGVAANTTFVSESSTAVFNVVTTNVLDNTTLYYSISSYGLGGSDFTDNALTGTVVINNNVGVVTKTLVRDFSTEGTEYFSLDLRVASVLGIVVASSAVVTVSDTPLNLQPSYAVYASNATVNEGSSVSFDINTTNVNDQTELFYSIQGTGVTANDFTDGTLTGSITVVGSVASVTKTLNNDLQTEGTKSFVLRLHSVSPSGSVLASSTPVVTISDTSVILAPTYSLIVGTTSVDEGTELSFTVTSVNVPAGTTLYYRINPTGTLTALDFVDNTLEGTVNINQTTVFSKVLRADVVTEGPESFTVSLVEGSNANTVLWTSGTVTVNDTSLNTNRSYLLKAFVRSQEVTQVTEGTQITFELHTSNVPQFTTLWYKITGNVTTADFVDGTLEGAVVTNAASVNGNLVNSLQIQKQLVNDLTTEGAETFKMRIYNYDETTGQGNTLLASSSDFTVLDTSITVVPTYSLTVGSTSVNEGNSVNFTVTSTNVDPSTVLYYTIDPIGSFSNGDVYVLSGAIGINTTNTVSISLPADSMTEGPEYFTVSLRTDSATGPVLITSATVTVNDTSTSIVPSYVINASSSSVSEGGTVIFNITTTNVPNNTQLFYTMFGSSIENADFTDNSLGGPVTIFNNAAVISKTWSNDLTTEGIKYYYLNLRKSSGDMTLATSPRVTVIDTSVQPIATYNSTLNRNDISEGESIICTLTTTNIPNGTVLKWRVSGSLMAVTAESVTGLFTVNSNIGTFTVTPAIDKLVLVNASNPKPSIAYGNVDVMKTTNDASLPGSKSITVRAKLSLLDAGKKEV